MSEKKYNKEYCIVLLKEKQKLLQSQGIIRYPKRSDFDERDMVAIKAFLGPWPRALEIAGIKPPRETNEQAKEEKKLKKKRAKIERLKNAEKEKVIIDLALSEGFVKAKVINTDQIVFNPAFRPYCEENLCGQYGMNYSCPPDCGTPKEMEERVLDYKNALVFESQFIIEDLTDKERTKQAKAWHNSAMQRVIKQLQDEGFDGFMIGASACSLCNPCKLVNKEPCQFPALKFSCMSAYCIYVKDLADKCGMNYEYKNNVLSLFGMYVYN